MENVTSVVRVRYSHEEARLQYGVVGYLDEEPESIGASKLMSQSYDVAPGDLLIPTPIDRVLYVDEDDSRFYVVSSAGRIIKMPQITNAYSRSYLGYWYGDNATAVTIISKASVLCTEVRLIVKALLACAYREFDAAKCWTMSMREAIFMIEEWAKGEDVSVSKIRRKVKLYEKEVGNSSCCIALRYIVYCLTHENSQLTLATAAMLLICDINNDRNKSRELAATVRDIIPLNVAAMAYADSKS